MKKNIYIKKKKIFVLSPQPDLFPAEKEEFGHPPLWNSQIPSKGLTLNLHGKKALKK